MERTRLTSVAAYLLATIPIVIGGLIYVAYRPESLLLFEWARLAGIDSAVDVLRTAMASHRPHDLLVHSAPAGMWAMSCSAHLRLIWRRAHVTSVAPLLALPALVGVGSELAQAFGACPGTFDLIDICFYLAGSLAGAVIPTTPGD